MTFENSDKDDLRLFCFGVGFSARRVIAALDRARWHVGGTTRGSEGVERFGESGTDGYVFDGSARNEAVAQALARATHVLISAPPSAEGDPVLRHHFRDLATSPALRWIGYLSTVGVYGDHGGGWVDEATLVAPVSTRSRYRAEAERAWAALGTQSGKRVVIFRLAGIYGPGRSAIDSVASGRARRIVKPGQRFNRIHVDDIAESVLASMAGRGTAPVLNVTDDEPAPPQDVIAYAAELMGAPMPPEIPFEDAELSGMAASFYGENKRVSNALLKSDLGLTLRYPTFREGLAAIVKERAAKP